MAIAVDAERGSAERWAAPRQAWVRRLTLTQVLGDLAAALAAIGLCAVTMQAQWEGHLAVAGAPFLATALACLGWLALLAIAGAYRPRTLSSGNDQYRRVLSSSVRAIATVAVINFFLELAVSRLLVVVSFTLVCAFTLLGRYAIRRSLHRRRGTGLDSYSVLAVGARPEVERLVRHFQRATWAGLQVGAACFTDDQRGPLVVDGQRIDDAGSAEGLVAALADRGASVVAVTGAGTSTQLVQHLAWQLEGRGVDLLVAPDLADVAGPRIRSEPVAGLPLLFVDEPRLTHPARLVKGVLERSIALVLLLLLTPLFVVLALAVKLTSSGPVMYKQQRVGRDGQLFTMWKLRTMVEGAHDHRSAIDDLDDGAGPLFKVREDPRLTRIGGFLRRHSLDELPQLVHVVTGTMALVGPRPPLQSEVDVYEDHVRRRMLVKPGLTGLWQISGRSDLDWDEAVRLDLYYVDNWSVSMDLAIMAKTFVTIVRGDGAY